MSRTRPAPLSDPSAAGQNAASPGGRAAGWLPGVLVCVGIGAAAFLLNRVWSSASPLLAAIIAGVVLANSVRLPAALAPGIALSGKRLLRIGIVLLGLQLSLTSVAALGAGVIGLVVAVVVLGIGTSLLWGRLLRMPVLQTLLIGCGFSICGAAAVAAVDGVVDAEDEEVATGIALVVLFGTLMIPIAPALGSAAGFDLHGRAVFVGGSVHEVAQVVAAAGVVGSGALATAVLVKLARVLMLAPVLAGISVWQRRHGAAQGVRPPLLPLFVAGFIAAVLVRTVLSIPGGVLEPIKAVETILLAAAMFALGLGVRVRTLRKVGPKPLLLGVLSTCTVATIAATGVWLIGV